MIEPVVSFFVNDENIWQIPDVSIKTFSLSSSIFSSYPGAELVIDDPEGKFLASLAIKPGNLIGILSAPGAQGEIQPVSTTTFSFCPLRVVGINNPGVFKSHSEQAQLGSIGGDFRLQLAHQWILESDWSNHAYTGSNSSIISNMLSQGKRGFAFSNISIDNSDDKGDIVRYKIAESEAQFIHRKLLPYTTIQSQATYSFVDETGGFHLHSFEGMYKKPASAIILPPRTDSISTKLYNSTAAIPQLFIYDGAWWIGDKFVGQLGVFQKRVYVENTNPKVGLSFVAKLPYFSSIPGYTLMKKNFIEGLADNGTSASVFPFREFEDVLRLNANNNGAMNEFFKLSITVDFSPDVITAGSTVQVNLAGMDGTLPHWMNGIWLAITTEHFLSEGRYYSKYMLARPAIKTLPSDIDAASLYYNSVTREKV